MKNSILLIVLISQESGEFTSVPVHHCQIQRPEILVERKIGEVVVYIEEKGVLEVLRWFEVAHPV